MCGKRIKEHIFKDTYLWKWNGFLFLFLSLFPLDAVFGSFDDVMAFVRDVTIFVAVAVFVTVSVVISIHGSVEDGVYLHVHVC